MTLVRVGVSGGGLGVCAAVAAVLLSGCAQRTPGVEETVATPRLKQGRVTGGQQPVSGATLQLYAVGAGGDGSAATPLLSPAAVTDANGNFTISGTYTCPGGNPLVYLVATGGNPGAAASNANLALMAALGPCDRLSSSTFITINELTTVGAVYPLAAFMTSTSAIGSGSGDAAALASAFTLASELVNPATGTTPGASVPVGTTIPVAQIDTIADILANCINSTGGTAGDGSGCGNLFLLTTPGSSAAPTNTIAALLYLASNPGMNTAALYALVPAVAPFQPAMSVTPADLAVRLISPSNFTVSPGSLSFGTLTTGFTSAAQSVTLTNNTANLIPVTAVALSGANAGDFQILRTVDDPSRCENSYYLLPGGSCTYQVQFAPAASGGRSAWLVITNGSANPVLTVGLGGTGVAPAVAGPVTVSPGTLTFSEFGVAQNLTLSNFGNTPLTINGFVFTGNYTQTNNCGSVLPAQSICTIAVTANVNSSNGVLTVVDDAAAGPQTVNLVSTLTGFTVPTHVDFGGWPVGQTGTILTEFYFPGRNYKVDLVPGGPNGSDFSAVSDNGSQCVAFMETGCTVSISFQPSGTGPRTGALYLSMTPPGSATATPMGSIPLSGVGDPAGPDFLIRTTISGANSDPSIDYTLNSSPIYGAYLNQSASTTFSVINTWGGLMSFQPPVVSGANPGNFSAALNCATLGPPPAFCTLTVTATPTQLGPISATITLTDSTNSVQRAALVSAVGVALPPTVSASELDFTTQVGTQSAAQMLSISAFQNDPITAIFSGGYATNPFLLTQGSSCPQTPCQLYVAFAPPSAGNFSSYYTLLISDPVDGQEVSVTLSGTGTPAPPPPSTVGLSTNLVTFPLRAVDTTSISQSVTVTNTGNEVLYINGVSLTGTNTGDYLLSNGCPSTLAIGAYCSFTVSFAPTASGTRTANVEVDTNALSSPDIVQLTGRAY